MILREKLACVCVPARATALQRNMQVIYTTNSGSDGRWLTNGIPVIILIAAEILVAAVNIVVDLYAGVD